MELAAIPDDIVEGNILTRLPVKSLLRFKCVSRQWFYLISRLQFVRNHMIQTASSNSNSNSNSDLYRKILALVYDPQPSFLPHPLFLLLDPVNTHNSYPELSFPSVADKFRISECGNCFSNFCHGLVLVKGLDHYNSLLWNPSTRTHKVLPSVWPSIYTNYNYHPYILTNCGLGYDYWHDDYKVVAVDTTLSNDLQVFIYSLNSNSWKDISRPVHRLFSIHSRNAVYLKGVLYWFATFNNRFGGKDEVVIMCFDLGDEVFVKMPIPFMELEPLHDKRTETTLTVCKGSVCLSYWSTECNMKIWLLKERSWINIISIPCNHRLVNNPRLLYLSDDCDKSVFMSSGGCIAIHNRKDNQWELVMERAFLAVPFCESLLSPIHPTHALRKTFCEISPIRPTRALRKRERAPILEATVENKEEKDKKEEEEDETFRLNSMYQKEARRMKRRRNQKGQKQRRRVLELLRISTKNRRDVKAKGGKKNKERIVEEAVSYGSTVGISGSEEEDEDVQFIDNTRRIGGALKAASLIYVSLTKVAL